MKNIRCRILSAWTGRLLLCGTMCAPAWARAADEVSPALAPSKPRKERDYKVPEGFQATIYAEPPEVRYPVCLIAQPDGTLFIGIDENGSIDRDPGRGSVIVARDLNQDGRGDQFVPFIPDIDSPRGLVWDGEWLYVLHPPELSAWRDTDGDGVADEKRVLVSGIGFDLSFRGADHTSNGIQMGVDGWIYAAIGDYGFKKAQGTDGRTLVLRGGGVVRVRPDGTGLGLVSRGQRNIYDVAVSPLLERFTRDNTNDGGGWDVRLSHIVDYADYGYPSLFRNFTEEIMPPLAEYGGGSPCGALWVQEPTLPEPWNDMLYTVEWGRSRVYAHPLEHQGAGYKADQIEFVRITRPTDMDVDASGRLYISSWEGGQFTYKGPDVGWMLEVRPDDWQPVELPDLKRADQTLLIQELASLSAVRRFHAQRELLRRDVLEKTRDALLALADKDPATLEIRVAALFTAAQAGVPARQLQLLATDAALRRFVIRALGDQTPAYAREISTPWFTMALDDPDPKVQREALIALARLTRTNAAPAVFAKIRSDDRVLSHTARKVFVELQQPQPALDALRSADADAFHAAQLALREMHDPAVIDGLVAALEETREAGRRQALLTTLVRLYHREDTWRSRWWGTRPDTTGPYYDRGIWSETPRIQGLLTNELASADPATAASLLRQMARHRVEFKEYLPHLVGRALQDPSLHTLAVESLVRQKSVPNFAGVLLETVLANEANSPDVRARAVEALTKLADRDRGISRAYGHIARWPAEVPRELWQVRKRFLTSDDRFRDVDSYLRLAQSGGAGDRLVSYAVLASAARRDKDQDRAAHASAAVAQAQQSPEHLAALLRAVGIAELKTYQDLIRRHTAHQNPAVREAALWAAPHVGLKDMARPSQDGTPIGTMALEEVMAALEKLPGDAGRGAKLFEQQACRACHTVKADEPVRGPYLGDIAKRYNRAELAMSILRPSATIAQGFETQWFQLKDETEIQGFVVSESGDEVRIRDITGNEVRLAKETIDRREKRDLSIMPEGLVDNLTPEGLASLLAYLAELDTP